MPGPDRSYYALSQETPFVALDCQKAFDGLNDKERLYAHYLSQASWYGSLIVLHQTSPESPLIFLLLRKLLKHQPIAELKKIALEKVGLSEEEFKAFLIYTAGIFFNMGNYRGFGDTKIVPGVLDKSKFDALIRHSRAYEVEKAAMDSLLAAVLEKIYSLDDRELRLGFGPTAITTYHSFNVEKADSDLIDRYMKSRLLEGWNTRLFKTVDAKGKTSYEIRLASVEEGKVVGPEEFEGATITVTKGDYSPLLARVNHSLALAKENAANETQVAMLDKYIEHFKTGSLDLHKDGSRYWIKDKGPAVESYIGFIENYRDPAGVRSEFEGFVAMVDKSTSEKFGKLVGDAEKILPLLPWDKPYEKDQFSRPDFTSLEVVAFGSSGIPSGINIPNYDDVRQNEGFKNVSLGNVIRAPTTKDFTFVSKEDQELLHRYMNDAFEVQVGLHELLGHGSGKLFSRNKDGTFNFDSDTVKDMETGGKITSWYEQGETFSTKFGPLSSAYEECRAEAVGFYLSTYLDVLKIFGYEGQIADDVKYVNMVDNMRRGLIGLEYYMPDKKAWGQAHCHARFVLLKVALEAGQGFVEIKEQTSSKDGKPDLLLSVDRNKIDTVGKPAFGKFLQKLQLYKSTGNIAKAQELFDHYSTITPQVLQWREVVVARRVPRRVLILGNTVLKDGHVTLNTYPETPEGAIQANIDRYVEDQIESEILGLWKKDEAHFK